MTCRFRVLLSDFNFNLKLSQRQEEYVDECDVDVQRTKRPKQSNAVTQQVSLKHVLERLLRLLRERRSRPPKMTVKISENSSRTFFRVIVTVEVTWKNRHHMFTANRRLGVKPLKFRKTQRLNDKVGVNSDCDLDDGQLKKKVRRKEERKNSKESEKVLVEKENKSAGDVRGDKVESSASSSRGFREIKRKGDEGSFHQSWHEDFQCPGQQCSSIALTSLLYGTIRPIELWKLGELIEVLLKDDTINSF